jgi:hypothetical protein
MNAALAAEGNHHGPKRSTPADNQSNFQRF